jgi:hypothetical protein
MFNPTSVVAASFGDYLSDLYIQHFSARRPEYATYLSGSARLILERLGNTNALYHNAEHTMMVTLVGQQIMRGRLMSEAIQPDDWLHYTIALLAHDIGYVRGICHGDDMREIVINAAGEKFAPPRGASDAVLAPYHVTRGMMYARDRFADAKFIDEERIARAIEFTQFPVPDDPRFQVTESEPALVRAADLIGQVADPFYHRRINGLFHELVETGVAQKFGYQSPIDLVEHYPKFFALHIEPYLGPALKYLELTFEGKQWLAQLYSNIFQVSKSHSFLGPFAGTEDQT